jgi:hypothetical protein
MDTPQANPKYKKEKWIGFLKMLPTAVKTIEKPAWVAIPVLLLVWFSGRLLEIMNGNAVFDAFAAFWLGIVMSLLLVLFTIGIGMRCCEAVRNAEDKRLVAVSWFGFFILVALAVKAMGGIQISANGLLATAAGTAEPARNATFMLMKYHSLNPLLALNLIGQVLIQSGVDVAALAPFVWNWNFLFFLYVWSFAFGIAMLVRQGMPLAKTLYLVAATGGLAFLLFLKSKSLVTTAYMIAFQAGVLMLLLWQMFLVYATLRQTAAIAPTGTAKNEMPFGETRKTQPLKLNYCGLPPSAIAMALAFIFVMPIMADLKHHAQMSYYGKQLVEEMEASPSDTGKVLVAVAPVSIRSGPSAGDDVLGVLPRGAHVRVHEVKFQWINMGKNNWVPEKFLRPLMGKEHVSRNETTKTPS